MCVIIFFTGSQAVLTVSTSMPSISVNPKVIAYSFIFSVPFQVCFGLVIELLYKFHSLNLGWLSSSEQYC